MDIKFNSFNYFKMALKLGWYTMLLRVAQTLLDTGMPDWRKLTGIWLVGRQSFQELMATIIHNQCPAVRLH